jgi:hypothetical protein
MKKSRVAIFLALPLKNFKKKIELKTRETANFNPFLVLFLLLYSISAAQK